MARAHVHARGGQHGFMTRAADLEKDQALVLQLYLFVIDAPRQQHGAVRPQQLVARALGLLGQFLRTSGAVGIAKAAENGNVQVETHLINILFRTLNLGCSSRSADENYDESWGVGWIPVDALHSPVTKVNVTSTGAG